jgi:hypothetical protein
MARNSTKKRSVSRPGQIPYARLRGRGRAVADVVKRTRRGPFGLSNNRRG